jgi:hypothetical protein
VGIVSVQADVLHTVVVQCLDSIDDIDGEVVAVGIVVVVDDADGGTLTRTFSSHARQFEKVGLFTAGLDCEREGDPVEDDDDDD